MKASSLGSKTKAPAERLDYQIDFSRWLPPGDSIAAIAPTIEGTTATIVAEGLSATAVQVWIEGGADGDEAHVTVIATTAGNRVKEVCFELRIKGC